MKLVDYILIYVGIAMCLITIVFYRVDMQGKTDTLNTEYANKLTSACWDAAATIDASEVTINGCAWGKKSKREETLSVFYDSLAYSFNAEYSAKGDEIVLYTPVVCMIDTNGYYISYNVVFDETGNITIPDTAEERNATTSLNTWSERRGPYIVRYYLSDNVSVITETGEVYEGERTEVYKNILERYLNNVDDGTLSKIAYFNDDEEFYQKKNDLIIKELNQKIEYYINQHNTSTDGYNHEYTFTMPEVSGEDWARLLENPTVISFLQGKSLTADNEFLNVYSFAGGELTKDYHYFIAEDADGNEIYHCLESSCGGNITEHENIQTIDYQEDGEVKERTITDTEYYYKGNKILKIYSTMEDCAKRGATPCKCVSDWR